MTQASRVTAGMSSAVTAEQPVAAVDNPQGRSPILLICEHASNRLPGPLRHPGPDRLRTRKPYRLGSGRARRGAGALAAARCAADPCDRLAPRARSQPRAFRAGFDLDAERAHHDPRQSRSRRRRSGRRRVREVYEAFHGAVDAFANARQAPGSSAPSFPSIPSRRSTADVQRPWQIGLIFDRDERYARSRRGRIEAGSGARSSA